MLNNIRNFAKTKSAGVLVGILIVPFVLWGMGGVFSGGNKNNIAKISNENISTKDFQNHLNSLNIELEKIIRKYNSQIVYTTPYNDLNKDHQIASQSVLTALRPMNRLDLSTEIRSFETPSSTDQSPQEGPGQLIASGVHSSY